MKQFLSCAKRVTVPYVVAAFVALLLFSCIESPLEPVAPSFDTQLPAPLFSKSWPAEDLVKKDSAQLKIDPVNGTFYVVKTQYPSPIQVDTLKVNPSLSSIDVGLGVFSVGTFSRSDYVDAAGFGISTLGDLVPPGTFSASAILINDTAQYDFARILSGYLVLTVTNNISAPIQFQDSVVLRNDWSNPIDNGEVASFHFPGTIPAGSSATDSVFLSGIMLRGLLTTDAINIRTTDTSSFDATDRVVFDFNSTNLISDSALAVIPRQDIKTDSIKSFKVDDSTKIIDAYFKSGNLGVAINTNLDVDTRIVIQIPAVIGSSSLPAEGTLTEGQPIGFPIEMTGARLVPDANYPDSLGTYVSYHVGITVINSNGVKKFVDRHDVVHADLQPGKTMIAQYITGNIKPQYMQINSSSKADYGLKDASKFYAQLQLGSMKLMMRLDQPTGGFPYDFTGAALVARNSKMGTTVSLPITSGLVVLDQFGQGVLDFSSEPSFPSFRDSITSTFPDLPDSFYVRGPVVTNPQSEYEKHLLHTIHDTTKVYPTITMTVPSNVGISNGYVDENYEIADIADSATIANIVDGKLNLECTNRIPLRIISRMNFLKWNPNRARNDTLPVFIPADTIGGAYYDTTTSTSTERVSRFSINLTSDDMDQINQADSVRVRLDLETSNSGIVVPVLIRVDDYIRIRASAIARVIVK
jgi:hypothetical protein